MGFYDDINIDDDNNNGQNFKLKNIQINLDSPNNDQDFLDNIELIQKNNFRCDINKNKKEEKDNGSNNIKEYVSEYLI